MARRTTRKRKSDFFKELNSALNFKISKKTRKNLVTAGFFVAMLFGAFVYFYPHPEMPKKFIPKKPVKTVVKPVTTAKPTVKKEKEEQKPAVQKPAAAPAVKRVLGSAPKIAFVIDDMGNTNHWTDMLEKLGDDVTYAILPSVPHSGYFDRFSLRTGAAVILHLPLESEKGTIPGPGLITSTMPDDYVIERLNRDLASVPHRIGVNNHMGSKGTSDPRIMTLILNELKRRGLFFLDSRTTPDSVAPQVAGSIEMPILMRDEFLDNVDEINAIRQEVHNLAEAALRKGFAIGIGHYRKNTLQVLLEEIPRLKAAGYDIVSLRDLI